MTKRQPTIDLPIPVVEPDATPAPDGGPPLRLRQLPWLRWPYLLVPLVPSVLLAVAAIGLWPEVHARLQVAGYRAATEHVQGFAWPAGFTDDATLTACGGMGTRCAASQLTTAAALQATADALGKVDVELGPVRCGADADPLATAFTTVTPSTCTAVGHAGDVVVYAVATEYARDNVPLGHAGVWLFVETENDRLRALAQTPPPPAPAVARLPIDITDLPGLPPLFDGLTCTRLTGDGCRQFDGTVVVPDADPSDVDASAAQLAGDLRAGGYLTGSPNCRDTDRGRRCTIMARVYRSAGAKDLTSVIAILSPDGYGVVEARLSVTLS